jgi:Sulfotransferase domain
MSQIVWLASYPKSGNTWLRIFLTNFQRNPDQPVEINSLDVGALAVDRKLFDGLLGTASSDMTPEEIECWRPEACRHMAARSATNLYVTTHDAYTFTPNGEPLIPADVTRGAIYVVRNPLDVAISFAHHFVKPVEEAVEWLGMEYTTGGGSTSRLRTQLRQRLLSWSRHVLSWLDQRIIPIHVMRYEDMSLRPIETFSAAVRFLGWGEDVERVQRAVAFSSFETLREQEQARGFKERQPGVSSFFRQGRAGAWREVLTDEQVTRIIGDHGTVMRRLGYLAESDSLELAL